MGAWNAWREENRDIRLDLSGVDLSRANLGGANFGAIRPDFSAIDDLTQLLKTDRTQLAKAPYLRSVRFIEANLSKAKFMQEDLSGADLSRANLGEINSEECSSCLVASSATVSWPLIASSATLDLNSAKNRLRVLMVIRPLHR